MRFSDWFASQQGLTQEAFAKRVGVTQGRIAQLISGDMPSMTLALAIEQTTNGVVTPNDFMPPKAGISRGTQVGSTP